jgi:arylsulfatase A-like enzyme
MEPARPERILLVTVDTLRADHVGCYGGNRAHTSHMDTIGAEGVRFAHAISPVPITLPAHATLMTGLDPPAHGVRHNSIHRLAGEIPTLAERLRSAGYATAAVVGAVVLERRFGLARGFDHYDDRMGGRRSGIVGYAERPADQVVDAALAWLEGAPRRLFLWVHFYDPHTAYDPPRGFAAAFAGHPYAGEIAFVDAQLGRLLAALDPPGATPALVVLTSDHGESLGEHGELTHSYTIYDATQRVPLLLRGPGLPAGVVVEQPVRLADVAPTVLDLAGARGLPGIDGESLLPHIRGKAGEPPAAYLETLATQLDFRWSPLLGLRSARWKYIRAPRPELYDLRLDPGELHNRAADEPEVVARLDRALGARLRSGRSPEAVEDLDAERREQLQGLGYLVPATEPPPDLGVVGGADPKDRMGVLRALAEAETLLTRGRPGEALARLDEVDETGLGVSSLRAAVALSAGDAGAAERAARLALAEAPRRADLLVLLGRALEAQRRWEEARQAFALASEADPASVSAWAGLSRALAALGRRDEARRARQSGRALGR